MAESPFSFIALYFTLCRTRTFSEMHVRFVKRQSCHVYSQSWKSTLSQNTWQEFQNRFCHVNQRNRTGFTQWLQAERRRAPLSACCMAYATGRRGSQGLAGAWAVRTEKQLEEKKKYQDSMVPAAKRAKSLYLPEELWHPGA